MKCQYENCNIIANFNIKGEKAIYCSKHKLINMIRTKKVVKEPYLICLLPYILECVKNIVLVVRNPAEVLASSETFIAQNHKTKTVFSHKIWDNYYETFLTLMKTLNIPYTVVNFDDVCMNTRGVVDNLYTFLNDNTLKKINGSALVNIYNIKHVKALTYMSPQTEILYTHFTTI